MMNSFSKNSIEFHEESIQIGIRIKLNPINNKAKPSTPVKILPHFMLNPKFNQEILYISWNWLVSSVLISIMLYIIIKMKHQIRDVIFILLDLFLFMFRIWKIGIVDIIQ